MSYVRFINELINAELVLTAVLTVDRKIKVRVNEIASSFLDGEKNRDDTLQS